MFKLALGVSVLIVLFSFSAWEPQVYSQDVDEGVIMECFQAGLNTALYPNERGLLDLNDTEIQELLVPIASKVFKDTIVCVYKKTEIDIGVTEVLAALPSNVENILLPGQEKIINEVKGLLGE
ncbi:MAG: hypothetical protein ABIE75_04070 [Candidatus Omnitrophota bacterium]